MSPRRKRRGESIREFGTAGSFRKSQFLPVRKLDEGRFRQTAPCTRRYAAGRRPDAFPYLVRQPQSSPRLYSVSSTWHEAVWTPGQALAVRKSAMSFRGKLLLGARPCECRAALRRTHVSTFELRLAARFGVSHFSSSADPRTASWPTLFGRGACLPGELSQFGTPSGPQRFRLLGDCRTVLNPARDPLPEARYLLTEEPDGADTAPNTCACRDSRRQTRTAAVSRALVGPSTDLAHPSRRIGGRRADHADAICSRQSLGYRIAEQMVSVRPRDHRAKPGRISSGRGERRARSGRRTQQGLCQQGGWPPC